MKNFLAVFFLLYGAVALASAPQSVPHRTDTLETVSVTGCRVPLSLGQSARMVTVLDSMAISSMPATTVNDILKYAVGVDVRQRGVAGMQTDVSIRGGSCDQIAVLLNGVSISDPQTGHNAVDLPIDMSEVERIEILEGPAARTYGTSSLLGAVNIVTKTYSSSGVSARIEGGSYGWFNGSVAANAKSGNMNNQVSAGYTRSDGYSRSAAGNLNSDFNAARLFWQGNYADTGYRINWHAGASNRNFGSNTFYSPRFDDQFEHTFKTFAAVQAETEGRLHLKPSVYWNHGEDRFELFRGNPGAYPFNYHRTNVLGLNLGGWIQSPLGKTAFSAEFRNEDIISTNLGEPLPSPVKVRGADAQYKVGLNRSDISFYLEHDIVLRRITLSAGMSVAGNSGNRAGFHVYPGADASLRISDSWKLYASYNSSLRMPSFTELYYSVGGYKADPNLKAEKMQAAEGGVKFLRPGVRAIATVYLHHGTDLIDWIKDTGIPDAPWESVNHAEINSLGEELVLRLELPVLLGRASFPVRNLSASFAHISQHKGENAALQSYYVLEYLRNKAVLQADLALWKGLKANVSARWIDRVGTYQLFESGVDTGRSESYKPYFLLDAKLSWDAGRYRLFLDAENLLDRTYFDHGNIPQPGLWLKLGLQLRVE